ncbi:MAG: alpha/beta hydrolase, partial [Anaerolineales bacterium]|nr:alpha/beta hydrolase [Anaerolineales bacterium]
LALSDGRTLAYCEWGDPEGHPVFYAHGGPGSRLEGEFFDQKARDYGFRLIATDRPGMGRSTFLPGRTLLGYPKDLLELAGSLEIDTFGVLGWSGGGAHTTVCGYAIPERLSFNIPLCGYTNFAELPGAAGMLKARLDQISVGLSQSRPRLFQLFFDLMKLSIDRFPGTFKKSLLDSVNDTDRKLLEDPALMEQFMADQKEAVIQGGRGVAVDAAVHYVDWGFRLAEISGRVDIFHGTDDYLVPFAYARHLADNIPQAELHAIEDQGHLFPIDHQDLIFETARARIN